MAAEVGHGPPQRLFRGRPRDEIGRLPLRVANILRDGEILEIARREAVDFIARPPSEDALRLAVTYIRDHWQRRYGLVTV